MTIKVKNSGEQKRKPLLDLSRGNSLMFLIIGSSFVLLFYTSTLYLSSTNNVLEQQNHAAATRSLLSTLGVAVPAAESAIKSGCGIMNLPELFTQNSGDELGEAEIHTFVLDRDFHVATSGSHTPEFFESVSFGPDGLIFETMNIQGTDKEALITEIQSDGHSWLVALVGIDSEEYMLGFAYDLTPYVTNAIFMQDQFLGFLVLMYVIFLGLLFLLLKVLTNPLKTLTSAAERFSEGDFDIKVHVPATVREISVLSRTFNDMGGELKMHRESLEAYSRELEIANRKRGDALAELSRRNRELSAMNETSMQANKLVTPEQVLELIVKRLRDDLRLAYAVLYVPSENGELVTRRLSGLPLPDSDTIPGRVKRILELCRKTNNIQILKIEPLEDSEGAVNPRYDSRLAEFGDRMYIPFAFNGEEPCVLELIAETGKKFTSENETFCGHFISHMEIILHNKGLYSETRRRSRELERLNQVSRMISSELDLSRLFEDVVDHTLNTIHAECAFIGVLEGDKLQIKSITPGQDDLVALTRELVDEKILREIINSAQSCTVNNLRKDKRASSEGFFRRNKFVSFVGSPIIDKDKVIGVLCGLCTDENRKFTNNDEYFLGLLCGQVAIALENASMFDEILTRDRRRDQQLAMAHKLQMDRLPVYFKQNVAAITCRLHPADELAGDFFDVFSLGRHSVAIVLGDVANKGIAASLMTFSLLSMFRNIAKTLKPPCDILDAINRALIPQIKDDCWFATCFYGKLNTKNKIFTYSTAGHEQPIWYKAKTGEVCMLEASGYPLGLFASFKYETKEVVLGEGDKIVFYTDGIPDSINDKNERFGYEIMMDLIGKNGANPGDVLADKIIQKVCDFTGEKNQRDDIIVAILDLQDDPWIHRKISFRNSGKLVSDILQALSPYELEQSMVYAIRLSVDESLANAWRHGTNMRDDVELEVSYMISDEGFQFRIRDPGSGFDHESLPDPTVQENLFKSHGRGVFLVRQVMDEVEFNDVGNEMFFIKKFPAHYPDFDMTEDELLLESKIDSKIHQDSLEKAKLAGDPVKEDDTKAIMNAFLDLEDQLS